MQLILELLPFIGLVFRPVLLAAACQPDFEWLPVSGKVFSNNIRNTLLILNKAT